MKDYYKILEISPSASDEVIKASYRALAKKYHPDTKKDSAEDKTMTEINEAYKVLSNPELRMNYDKEYEKYFNSVNNSENKMSRSVSNSSEVSNVPSEKSYDNVPQNDTSNSERGFFSFIKKVGSAMVEDYKQTCDRRNKEIENAYMRAQGMSDERLIYRFRTSSGTERLGYAKELEYRGYLYKDDEGVYQTTYKYKNFRY